MKKPLLEGVAFFRFLNSLKVSNKTCASLAISDDLNKHYPVANVVGEPLLTLTGGNKEYAYVWQFSAICYDKLLITYRSQEVYYG
jgi:hypothetical protein